MPDQSKVESQFVDLASPCEKNTYRAYPDSESSDPRYISDFSGDDTNYGSYNTYVTPGGRLSTRPPFISSTFFGASAGSVLSNKRIDRLWWYETLPDTSGSVKLFALASVYNFGTNRYEMYYNYLTSPTWTIFTNLRDINNSYAPHLVTFDQGIAYVKGFPNSSEKLGTISFDGSTGTPVYNWWGVLGPSTGVQMSGWISKLTAAVTDTATAWTVSALSAPPATPFTAQAGYEQVTVTAVAGAGPYNLTVTRGINGTTAKAYSIFEPVVYRDWAASDHQIQVTFKWDYGYGWVTKSTQYSNMSPLRTNPDEMASATGPFNDLVPKMTVTGDADTTNIPYIQMYRSADGGGQYFALEKITNTGAGAITYYDDSFASGSGSHNDPVPDGELDTSLVAPDQTNSPPPTVNPPLVVGTDTPSINATKIVRYANRQWMAILNKLYFSGDEEITVGVLPECWPSGTFGNVYNFTETIVSLESVDTALYVLTTRGPYILTGSSRDSFNINFLGAALPMNPACKTGSVAFLNRVAFICHDGRLAVITGQDIDIISESIGGVTTTTTNQILYLGDYEHQYLVVCTCSPLSSSKVLIYDWARSQRERRDFWFAPWYGFWTAMALYQTSNQTGIMFAAYDPSLGAKAAAIVEPFWAASGSTSTRDDVMSGGTWSTSNFNYSARVAPLRNPAGNLVNKYTIPTLETALYEFKMDFTAGAAGVPSLGFVPDGSLLSTAPTSMVAETPARRPVSTGYTTREFRPNMQVTMDYALVIGPGSFTAGSAGVQVQRLAAGTAPESGING